jgi:bifunctional DNA-binding transcriptional regulator/antitoxin component of YhaV-PrlF toxin-antitoxin module
MLSEPLRIRVKAQGSIELPLELIERYQLQEGDELELVPELASFRVRKPSRRDLSKFVGIARETALAKTTDEYMRDVRGR